MDGEKAGIPLVERTKDAIVCTLRSFIPAGNFRWWPAMMDQTSFLMAVSGGESAVRVSMTTATHSAPVIPWETSEVDESVRLAEAHAPAGSNEKDSMSSGACARLANEVASELSSFMDSQEGSSRFISTFNASTFPGGKGGARGDAGGSEGVECKDGLGGDGAGSGVCVDARYNLSGKGAGSRYNSAVFSRFEKKFAFFIDLRQTFALCSQCHKSEHLSRFVI